MTRKKINADKPETVEIDANLTESDGNTTLQEEVEALQSEVKDLRGRRSERASARTDSEPRKRKRNFVGRQLKLDVTHYYDTYPGMFEGKVLRWANDEDGNIQGMMRNDWEIVKLPDQSAVSDRLFVDEDEREKSKGDSVVKVPGGRGKNHDFIQMVLMMKEKSFYEEDEVQTQRDQMQAQTAALTSGVDQSNERVGSVSTKLYAPKVGGEARGMSIQKQIQRG